MSRNERPQKQWVFLNESGSSDYRDWTRAGTTQYFVLVAVLVADSELGALRSQVEGILRAYGSLHTETSASDDAERVVVLEALRSLPLRFLATAVDTVELARASGLIYREPFYKSICSFLYGKLRRAIHDLETVADERIDRDFMDGLAELVHR